MNEAEGEWPLTRRVPAQIIRCIGWVLYLVGTVTDGVLRLWPVAGLSLLALSIAFGAAMELGW